MALAAGVGVMVQGAALRTHSHSTVQAHAERQNDSNTMPLVDVTEARNKTHVANNEEQQKSKPWAFLS